MRRINVSLRKDRARLTYQDLLLMPDDRMRHEIIEGDHYALPTPSTRHP